MNAHGVWAGLAESVFLAGVEDRERDPRRLSLSVLGGVGLALVAAISAILLIMAVYAIVTGLGGRGFAGLDDVETAFVDSRSADAGLTILRLVIAAVVDGGFWVVFVAAVALMMRLPLLLYVTVAAQVRWRLLLVAMVLSAAALAPLVVAEWLLGPQTAAPVLAVSPLPGPRVLYALSTLLLIPAAAAEELFFRGWLLRQTSVLLRRPAVLVAVTALVFSAAHLDFTPDAFLTRALMGAGFAYMTLRLGGIEFATGVHAVNNMVIALFLQPLDYDQPAGAAFSAFSLVQDMALVGTYVLITELVARLPALRRLAGVRMEEISPSHDVSAHFG